MPSRVNNILLTGLPGCGKTTVVRRVVETLDDLRVAGFYTRELREHGKRIGFEAVGLLAGDRAILAHVSSPSRLRVGRYGVELSRFEPLIERELGDSANVELFVVDEIGKMECYSNLFVDRVTGILDSPIPVLATVALKGGGFIQQAKRRPDVELVTVNAENREGLPLALVEKLHASRG